MALQPTSSPGKALARLQSLLPDLEALYTDVHAHPELSMQESRTASLVAEQLRAAGYDVTTKAYFAMTLMHSAKEQLVVNVRPWTTMGLPSFPSQQSISMHLQPFCRAVM